MLHVFTPGVAVARESLDERRLSTASSPPFLGSARGPMSALVLALAYFNSSLRCNICSMDQPDALEAVASLAERQWGMFTTAQAEARGVPRTDVARLVRRELARRLRHGVHMMPGVPSSPFEDIRAEWLATDPARTAGERRDDPEPVIVSDESAALIHGMGDLPPGGVHLTSARRLQSRQQWVTIHRRHVTDREYDWVDGLPVTTPRRTLEDLAESGRWEQSQLRALAHDAVTHGLIPASDLVKSPTLARVLPELAAPASHTALRQRLSNDARERGVDPPENLRRSPLDGAQERLQA
jgi:Transcriptional regulator, AbiEi antitoxin